MNRSKRVLRRAWVEEVIIQEDLVGEGTDAEPLRNVIIVRRKNGEIIAAQDTLYPIEGKHWSAEPVFYDEEALCPPKSK